jgi:hypothetical protein
MPRRRNRLVLYAFALLLAAWMFGEALTGGATDLLHLAPALVLALPLILGRYPGETRLAELARRSHTPLARCRPSRIPMPRSHVRVMQRGGRLVATAMAKRPPPALAAPSSTPT